MSTEGDRAAIAVEELVAERDAQAAEIARLRALLRECEVKLEQTAVRPTNLLKRIRAAIQP